MHNIKKLIYFSCSSWTYAKIYFQNDGLCFLGNRFNLHLKHMAWTVFSGHKTFFLAFPLLWQSDQLFSTSGSGRRASPPVGQEGTDNAKWFHIITYFTELSSLYIWMCWSHMSKAFQIKRQNLRTSCIWKAPDELALLLLGKAGHRLMSATTG